MNQNKMPRTPFSMSLSGSARETELRLKQIFSGPKKRPPALFLILMFSVCLLCGNLVSCQSAGAHISGLSAAAPAALQTGADQIWNRLFRAETVSLGQWKGKPLSLELEERVTQWRDSFQIDRIRVLLDGEEIQTIPPPELSPGRPCDDWHSEECWGLFHWEWDEWVGRPMPLDLNFDGHMDFGLVEGATPARNCPYIFYLWDPEREQFDCFCSLNYILEADPATRQLFETIYGGNEGDTRSWYAWEDGQLVLVRREQDDFWNVSQDLFEVDGLFQHQYITHVYERENGQLAQKEDEFHYYPAG